VQRGRALLAGGLVGQVKTEIAARPGLVPAEAVIVIPAGVPHRIWSSSSAPVRYLDIDGSERA
jgi:mannose-6-phosphate isomerase-like protein (cupin superfamily)